MSKPDNEPAKPDFGDFSLDLWGQTISTGADKVDLSHPENNWEQNLQSILTYSDIYPAAKVLALNFVNLAFTEKTKRTLNSESLGFLLALRAALKSPLKRRESTDMYHSLQIAYESLRLEHSHDIPILFVVIEKFGAKLEKTDLKKPLAPTSGIRRKLKAEFGKDFREPYSMHPYLAPAARAAKEQICQKFKNALPEKGTAEDDDHVVTTTMDHYNAVIDAFDVRHLYSEGPVVEGARMDLWR